MLYLIIQALINGVMNGAIYALIAVGITVIFGVMRLINFASGAYLMLSMYIGYIMYRLTGWNCYALIPAVAIISALVAYNPNYEGGNIMRDFSIDLVWAKLQMAIAAVGGWLGYFVGGVDGLMTALLVLMVMDYVTGIMCAVIDRELSSSVGFRGIFKKVLILMLVGVAHIVDLHVVRSGEALRSAVICFYLSNEGVSVLENAGHLGLPIPEKLKGILAQLHDRIEEADETEDGGQ